MISFHELYRRTESGANRGWRITFNSSRKSFHCHQHAIITWWVWSELRMADWEQSIWVSVLLWLADPIGSISYCTVSFGLKVFLNRLGRCCLCINYNGNELIINLKTNRQVLSEIENKEQKSSRSPKWEKPGWRCGLTRKTLSHEET